MERLTTNKEVSEMNMIELAHNSCYGKDGNARYRDFETDVDARELAIKLLDKHADIPNEFTCDDDFDDFIADSLQYGTDDMLGLIAVFYRNLWAMANLRGRLKYYEDLQEQNKLLILPCAVGDTVYCIYSRYTKCSEHNQEFEEYSCQGCESECDSKKEYYVQEQKAYSLDWIVTQIVNKHFGKLFFLTKEQAESELKEMEGKE